MIEYKRAFLDYHGLTEADYLGCAICNAPCADLHHVMGRRGKYKNDPRYILPLCRLHHDNYHFSANKVITKEQLLELLKKYNHGEATSL